jgi:hypothetical protein
VLFVGRASVGRLLAAVEDAAVGNARLVLVAAGGHGRPRWSASLPHGRLAVGWGTGAEAERTPAFWPWTAALRALLSTVDPAEVAG